jgi:bifunctional non-homologous end joining protein LigD
VPHLAEDGEGLFAAAVEQGFEGIMAKRADSAYAAGRSRAWLKIKAERTGDFAVVGTSPPSPSTFRMPSVLLAARSGSGLRYAGRAAIAGKELAALHAVAASLARAMPACLGAPPRAETWFEPLLVCEVRFLCWTGSGALRQPVFLRFRPDKTAAEIARHPAGDEPPKA